MKYRILTILLLLGGFQSFSQSDKKLTKPKLVVGIVVDQMRWDYLYRFRDRYTEGGFKRLQSQGFSVENTYINHTPSITAVGHATIFTGSVPAIHGITGNSWRLRKNSELMYCVSDTSVAALGLDASQKALYQKGQMSPRNLLTSTITDELRLASNFRSKVVGVSFKDRSAILPAGHAANAAFWYEDNTAQFISSSYYMADLPAWVKQFNAQKEPAQLMSKPWQTLFPIASYEQSSRDDVSWEVRFNGLDKSVFPYDMPAIYQRDKMAIRSTPMGNDLVLDFAKAALKGYQMGLGKETDFLTVSLTTPDAAGHQFGPNAIEVEDIYLRLDRSLAAFFSFLDEKYGDGNYLVFLSADHGAPHAVDFLAENKLPNGNILGTDLRKSLNTNLENLFHVKGLIKTSINYSFFFDYNKLAGLDFNQVKQAAVRFLEQEPDIQFAVDVDNASTSSLPEPLKTMIINGNNRKRTGDLFVVPNPGYFEASKRVGVSHGVWNPFDTHIPLIFMGWGIKHGSTSQIYHQNDIAITLANLLKIQAPSGNIGTPILELLDKR